MSVAPWLIIAVGNPSRGDDGLGPMLLERLQDAGLEDSGEVDLLTDFQLQIEHALDVQGRRGVLFVDAALPDAAVGATLRPIQAETSVQALSHALRPQAVLNVAQQLHGSVPPAWLLAIQGQSFELGEGLSEAASAHLVQAQTLALDWLRQQRAAH